MQLNTKYKKCCIADKQAVYLKRAHHSVEALLFFRSAFDAEV